MTRPETCSAEGGAISLWVKAIDCNGSCGIVSSSESSKYMSEIQMSGKTMSL